jgi:proline iminopeptidase
VLGLGFGAMVAAAYAARHPDHPGKVVLCNPAARVVPARSVAVYRRLGGERAGEAVRLLYEQPSERTFGGFLQHCFPHTTRYEPTAELAARAHWTPEVFLHWKRTAPAEVDLREALGRVRAPTLVLAGADDPEMTMEGARETVDALPRAVARFHSFAGARHSVFRDAPEAVDVLLEFLREEPGDAP